MKQFLLPLCALFMSASAFSQVSNGDFERWTKLPLFFAPVSEVEVSSSNSETFYLNGTTNVYEVAGESSSAMRIENISLEDEIIPGYYIIGTEPDSQGENLVFGGGFSISDANVNGLSMDLRYDFPNGSEGFVIVQFKNDDTPVGPGSFGPGTYLYFLDGEQDWETTTFGFGESIDPSVNQCVIGIASADLISGDVPFDAASFVEVDNISLVNSTDVVPTGGFESWAPSGAVFIPDDIQIELAETNAFERSTLAFEGVYALQLITKDVDESAKVGTALLASEENGLITPTIEVAEGQTSLSFMYLYQGVNEDIGSAQVVFFSEEGGAYTTVFLKNLDLPTNNSYELFTYNFSEDLGILMDEVDYISIEFHSSKLLDNEAEIGSSLWVDDLKLDGALGFLRAFKNPRTTQILASPNPTVDIVRFQFGTTRSGFYRVFNGNGTQVAIRQFSSARTVTHDLSGLAPGKYFFKFFHNGGTESVRVMKL